MQELIKESSRQGPDGSPVGGGAGPGGIAGGEQHGELMSGQASRGAVVVRGPPGEAALGEPFVTEPKTLTVIHKDLQGGGSTIAEDEDGAGEGIVLESVLTESSQAIDAATEVNGLDGDEDFHVRGDLEHHRASPKPRARASMSAAS